MKRNAVFTMLVAFVLCASTVAAFGQEKEGYTKIFNGKDLTGWKGNPKLWSVENGAIVGQTNDSDKKITRNEALYYADDLEIGDFQIEFDYKISNWGNSGLYYRGWFLDGAENFHMGGYQGDFDGSAMYSGIMYGEALRGILANLGTASRVNAKGEIQELARFATPEEVRANVKIEDWNHYEIFAQGYLFIHKINGKVTSVFIDEDSDDVRRAKGVLGWQLHVGDGGMRVEIKNIYLKKL